MNYRQELAMMTRKRILDSAMKLFNDKGFEQVSITDIMKEANVSRASFYNYFSSKESLLAGVLQGLDELYWEYYENTLCSEDCVSLSYTDKLSLFMNEVNRLISANGAESVRFYYMYLFRSAGSEDIDVNDRRYTEILRRLVSGARSCGELNDILSDDEICDMCLVLNRGICTSWALENGRGTLDSHNALIEGFLTSIRNNS